MRSAPSLKVAAAAVVLLTSISASAETIVVLELRSQVKADATALTERVREVARRTLPDAVIPPRQEFVIVPSEACKGDDCDLQSARELRADLVATGSLDSAASNYRVTLQLRDVRSGQIVSRTQTTAATLAELNEAVTSASADLFRIPQKEQAQVEKPKPAGDVITIEAPALPELPAMPNVLEGGAVNLSVDANVLVAYDHARTVELRGKERPEDAAYAWEAVANSDGQNPYRAIAAERAAQWHAYSDSKHAYESQLSRDTSRLRKVLPLQAVTDLVKLQLLERYSQAYGPTRATAMLPYVPQGALRERAVLAVGCDGSDAGKCIALARFADDSNDLKSAAAAWSRACDAGAVNACVEAANRDPSKATALLDKGCSGGDARACVRLAKSYDESNAVLAQGYRQKACEARDGKSCRVLALALDASDDPAEQKRGQEFFRKGCAAGDSTSCVMARMAQPQPRAAVQASYPVRVAEPVKPALQRAPAVTTQESEGHPAMGAVLVGLGILAAGTAFVIANEGPDTNQLHSGRNWSTEATASSGGHAGLVPVLGAAAALSTAAGIGVFIFGHHGSEPKDDAVKVGVSPAGVLLQGKL